MVANKKVTGNTKSMTGGLALGWIISMSVTLIGSMVVAYLLSSEKIMMSSVGYGSIIILLTAGMLGAGTAVRCIRRRRMVVCMVSGGVYFLSLLALTALFFGGQYSGIGVTALVIFGTCLAVGLLGIKKTVPKGKRGYL